MAAVDDVDQLIEHFNLASNEFLKGNPEPAKKMFSHREDVTLANPLGPAARGVGPVAHGWEQVAKTIEHASSTTQDGELTSVETLAKHVTAELAYVVQIERQRPR